MVSTEDLYFTARVHRATRMNILEQSRLQRRLQLLDRDRVRQSRLTNQDIRLISTAWNYVLINSGHSPEGWDGEVRGQRAEAWGQGQGQQLFLYGERVVSRKVHRMPRPLTPATFDTASVTTTTVFSADDDMDNATDIDSSVAPHWHHDIDHHSSRAKLARPFTCPVTRGRTWVRHGTQPPLTQDTMPISRSTDHVNHDCDKSPPHQQQQRQHQQSHHQFEHQQHQQQQSSVVVSSRPNSTPTQSPVAFFNRKLLMLTSSSRETAHRAWEDEVHEVTRRLLRAQQQQGHHHHQHGPLHHQRRRASWGHHTRSCQQGARGWSQQRAGGEVARVTCASRTASSPTHLTLTLAEPSVTPDTVSATCRSRSKDSRGKKFKPPKGRPPT